MKFVDDQLSDTFDRSYKHDHLGRTVEAKAGTAARGQTSADQNKFDQPYSMTYQHDAFGHITQVGGLYYNSSYGTGYSFTDNRNAASAYDVEGNTLADTDAVYQMDAAGRTVSTAERNLDDSTQMLPPTRDYIDGSGELGKRIRNYADGANNTATTNYYIRSSVLGKVISETDGTGRKLKTYVSANGVTLAEQSVANDGSQIENLSFIHQDASGASLQQTTQSGELAQPYGRIGEYDALGRNVADAGPYVTLNTPQPPDEGSGILLGGTAAGYRPGRNTY